MRQVISDTNWITIKFDYDERLVNLVKASLPGRSFDRSTKRWRLPSRPYNAFLVINILEREGFTFDKTTEKLASRAIAIQDGATQTTTKQQRSGLYLFQSAAVDFIEQCGGRVLLGDDMGLGKTVVSLWWIESKKEMLGWGLVVAPANVIYKWEQEVFKWTTRVPHILATRKEEIPVDADLHICSYSILTSRHRELMEVHYDFVILDECHYTKNFKSQRTAATTRLCRNVPYVLALSGTPFLNRPSELWPILHILDPVAYEKFYQFGERYCGGHRSLYQGATRTAELQQRLKSAMIRRLKSEVLDQLPDLTRTILPVEIRNLADYKRVKRGEREAILDYSPHHKGYFDNPLDRLTLLRQVVGMGKIEAVSGWITNFLETTDRQLVIYCHHKDVVERAEKIIKDVRFGIITGDVSPQRRSKIVEKIQDGSLRALIMTSAGGEGIDLYSAQDILFVEREWTPAKEEQIEGRLHRIGQDGAVNAYYVMALKTVDEDVARLIDQKRHLLKSVVGMSDVDVSIVNDLLEVLDEGS